MNTINLDTDCCTGCKTCFRTCFVNVYRWDEEADRPVIAYPEDCVECNKCELSCPEECIEVVPDYEHNYWPPVV